MAKVLNAKKRKCDVLTNGPLPELAFVMGPVYNCRLTTDQIVRLVSNGKMVYEINPVNPKEKVLLTVATCSKSAFGEVVKPEVVEPVVPAPTQVVMTASQAEKTDPHIAFLEKIGKTEDEWRRMSKSEKKRLKAQYNDNKSANIQDVTIEQNEETEVFPKVSEVTSPVVENNPVEETIEETITEETPLEDTEINEEISTEEAVVSADM